TKNDGALATKDKLPELMACATSGDCLAVVAVSSKLRLEQESAQTEPDVIKIATATPRSRRWSAGTRRTLVAAKAMCTAMLLLSRTTSARSQGSCYYSEKRIGRTSN